MRSPLARPQDFSPEAFRYAAIANNETARRTAVLTIMVAFEQYQRALAKSTSRSVEKLSTLPTSSPYHQNLVAYNTLITQANDPQPVSTDTREQIVSWDGALRHLSVETSMSGFQRAQDCIFGNLAALNPQVERLEAICNPINPSATLKEFYDNAIPAHQGRGGKHGTPKFNLGNEKVRKAWLMKTLLYQQDKAALPLQDQHYLHIHATQINGGISSDQAEVLYNLTDAHSLSENAQIRLIKTGLVEQLFTPAGKKTHGAEAKALIEHLCTMPNTKEALQATIESAMSKLRINNPNGKWLSKAIDAKTFAKDQPQNMENFITAFKNHKDYGDEKKHTYIHTLIEAYEMLKVLDPALEKTPLALPDHEPSRSLADCLKETPAAAAPKAGAEREHTPLTPRS